MVHEFMTLIPVQKCGISEPQIYVDFYDYHDCKDVACNVSTTS